MHANIETAIELCRKVEAISPLYGCHVALTGGTLYKDGARKDIDILFYRIRQTKEIDLDGLWNALGVIGLKKRSGFGWCYKGVYNGIDIDMFFPEDQRGEYNHETHRAQQLAQPALPIPV